MALNITWIQLVKKLLSECNFDFILFWGEEVDQKESHWFM